MASGRARAGAALALVAAALTLVVIAASATLRQAQAGLGCADWPSCYARVGAVATTGMAAFVRGAHRLAALGASLALVALLVVTLRERVARRWVVAALAIVAGLAVLGLVTAGARLPAIGLANLLGGFALLAVLAAGHAKLAPVAAIPSTARTLARVLLALALAQATLGGLVATQSALLACPSFPGCDEASLAAFARGGAWNPWRIPVDGGGRIVAPEGAALLHLAHRALGVVVAGLALALAWALRRDRGELAVFVAAAAAAGAGAGIAAALLPSALGVAIVHNVSAALLIALAARAAAATRAL